MGHRIPGGVIVIPMTKSTHPIAIMHAVHANLAHCEDDGLGRVEDVPVHDRAV